MESGAEDFDHDACRDAEGLDLRCVELIIFDFVFLRDEQDEIFNADVHLAVAVVFEGIEPFARRSICKGAGRSCNKSRNTRRIYCYSDRFFLEC